MNDKLAIQIDASSATTLVASNLSAIERMAKDPTVDVAKLERILDMQMKMVAIVAEQRFNEAMTACCKEMPEVRKDCKNSQTNSKYAKLETISRVAKPIYHRHGFSLKMSQGDCPNPPKMRFVCKVSHVGGHSETHHLDLSPDDTGQKGNQSKTKLHGELSTLTYFERYIICGVFDITLVGFDNDGNGPAQQPAPSAARDDRGNLRDSDAARRNAEIKLWSALKEVRGDGRDWAIADKWLDAHNIIRPPQSRAKMTSAELDEAREKSLIVLDEQKQ